MEMGASQLAVRIVGSIGRIDQGHLRTGKLTDAEWPRLTEAIEKLRNISLHIDETPGLTTSELRANARRLSRQCGKLGLIVVDYLQLMSVSTSMSDENRATAVGEISRGLKMLAKELQCPVIALSQLQPRRRVAHRQAADDERPARVGRDRAGRRRHHVHLPRRLLQQGLQGARRHRNHHQQAAKRPHRDREAGIPEGNDALRKPGSAGAAISKVIPVRLLTLEAIHMLDFAHGPGESIPCFAGHGGRHRSRPDAVAHGVLQGPAAEAPSAWVPEPAAYRQRSAASSESSVRHPVETPWTARLTQAMSGGY
jgi:hypothetical protein